MAPKHFHLSCLMLLILLVFSAIGHAKRNIPSEKKTSPFDFINELKGCQKGNLTKGINKLKAYLHKFGYLDYPNQTHANNDDFDDALEAAIKTYQENFHITPTGTLDATSIAKMTAPRCGVPDIVNGTNYMRPHERQHDTSLSPIHTVSHYSFFRGNPKWPDSKTHLTFMFLTNVPTEAMAPVARAFTKWASATQFTFSQTNQNADLVIGFLTRDHNDGAPFEGPGGTLAHAFAPTDGRLHFDADERWSIGPVTDAYDLETIAMHEIGHLLGLGHSSIEEALMYPAIPTATVKSLHEDDIQGIKALYNV